MSNLDPGDELLWFPTLFLTAFQTRLTLSSTQTILSGITSSHHVIENVQGRKDRGADKVSSVASDVSPSDSPVSAVIQHPRAFAWRPSVENFVQWEWKVIYSQEKWQPVGHAIQSFEDAPLTVSTIAWIHPQQHNLQRLYLPKWPWNADAFVFLIQMNV